MAKKLAVNYEKFVLGLALIITTGLGTMIYVQAAKLEVTYARAPVTRNPAPPLPSLEDGADGHAPGLAAALAEPVSTGDGRAIDTFTGVPLYVDKRRGAVVDLADPNSRPVHPPIPNSWWGKYGLDPRFAESPEHDPDGDGFTNREEYDDQTDPTDIASHGPLIDKLEVQHLEQETIFLAYKSSTVIGAPRAGDTHGFSYLDGRNRRNVATGVLAGRGGVLFANGPGQGRFELGDVSMIQRRNPRTNANETVYIATVIDRSPGKNGLTYRIEKGARRGITIRDFSATLVLKAVGQETQTLKVAEGGTFSLPFGSPRSQEYTFKEVNPDGKVVIEWREGNDRRQGVPPTVPETVR